MAGTNPVVIVRFTRPNMLIDMAMFSSVVIIVLIFERKS